MYLSTTVCLCGAGGPPQQFALSNSAAIRAEIQRFESVHPNIYAIYDLIERIEDLALQNQIREHVISIEGERSRGLREPGRGGLSGPAGPFRPRFPGLGVLARLRSGHAVCRSLALQIRRPGFAISRLATLWGWGAGPGPGDTFSDLRAPGCEGGVAAGTGVLGAAEVPGPWGPVWSGMAQEGGRGGGPRRARRWGRCRRGVSAAAPALPASQR